MSYNTNLPPTIVRTEQTDGSNADKWELRTANGELITSYSTVGIGVADWWEDILTYVSANSSDTISAVEDITLLMMRRDWNVEA